jgi:hypothetical protein
MNRLDENSWIDGVMEKMPASSSGDTIIGSIGSATNAAIGKQIVQVANVLGPPQPGVLLDYSFLFLFEIRNPGWRTRDQNRTDRV